MKAGPRLVLLITDNAKKGCFNAIALDAAPRDNGRWAITRDSNFRSCWTLYLRRGGGRFIRGPARVFLYVVALGAAHVRGGALKIINFLRGEGKLLDGKNYRYSTNDFICRLAGRNTLASREIWLGGRSFEKKKKDRATEKSRVTNGVNSSTRNSLIGVSDISFRGGRGGGARNGETRGDGLGHENHQLTIVLRAFLRETPLWRSRSLAKTASSCQRCLILLTSLFLRRSPRRSGNDITEWKPRELNNAPIDPRRIRVIQKVS